MNDQQLKTRQPVKMQKGQTVLIEAGRGVTLELTRFPSGAVTLRNFDTGNVIRAWTPKEAKG